MAEGVSGLISVSSLTGIMSGRYSEPDCQKQATRMTPYRPVESGQDNISLNRQEAPPLTDARHLKNGQFADCAFPVLRQLVSRIVQDQHTAGRINDGALEAGVMDKVTPENAKALVANDGHWQPAQTAARIISFALTISGNNRKKLEYIKESITGGFQLASESFGGELPEISGNTYTAIMNGLDEWAKITDDF